MAAPTTQELLDTARQAYAQALSGKSFSWGGRRYESQDISVLDTAIRNLEARVAQDSCASKRHPFRVGF